MLHEDCAKLSPEKVYVTAEALDEGGGVYEVDLLAAVDCGCAIVSWISAGGPERIMGHEDWHRTKEAAQARVREMAEEELRRLVRRREELRSIVKDGVPVLRPDGFEWKP